MKKSKNHLKDWEMLENKWQDKLFTHEEQLPEGLWEKLEGRGKREEGIGKRGKGRSVVFIRWSAAASVLLLLFFWFSFEKQDMKVEGTVPELVEGGKLKIESGKWKVESVKKNFQSKKERLIINAEPSIESIARVSVKNEMPVESNKSTESVELVKSIESIKLVESVKSVVQAEVDEMVVVVDVVAMEEPIKKVNTINKVIGFIKKVKSGKLLDLTTKNREGKLNDGIHRVMYQYEEKEEKLKNTLSL